MSVAGQITRIHCGTFDAEQYWRGSELAKLPGLVDKENLRIVSMMDELLFAFCNPNEALITRKAMNPAHKQYLGDIGFRFYNNEFDLDGEGKETGKSMLQLLTEADHSAFTAISGGKPELEPFAAIPFTREASERHGFDCRMPDMDIIRRVNTKTYSTEMKERLDLANDSFIVNHSSELQLLGESLLRRGPFLIKDNYGVSGQGNLLVESISILERVVSYTAMQENKGKQSQFVVEPYLDKDCDFSCQFMIAEDGAYQLISVQRLANDEFAYQESYTPEPEFLQMLEGKGYFDLMERIAKGLYSDGYYGHVCVDSMQLRNGDLIPLIEINARKSMSLIKNQVDRFLTPQDLQGNLRYYSVTTTNAELQFEDLLAAMEDSDLLYRPGKDAGIIPLTANTLTINRKADKPYKGRLYVSMAGRHGQVRQELHQKLSGLLSSFSLQVMN
ncbi:conserved hypothetical protein [Paenibacillus curdlanolyticus YK9]|uniref:ATP-grasp domain-containing protein n=1 Tax=Paenibacillus curdlanolyticus YK9 TaxID=717606 RepID=E0I5W1_9BACL|nr:hypothetical protein [Paenibacillus curdlanolyticus]EFM12353.1 conserved hypothetical protein [Paenibacillus curdlanolyticus YK9]